MDIRELRAELGLSLQDLAERVGLASKGQMAFIIDTGRCSVPVALKIEELSKGRIPASSLNPDVGLVERARGLGEEAA